MAAYFSCAPICAVCGVVLWKITILAYIYFIVWVLFPLEQVGFFFYMISVSGNILAPLDGFNGHDREYALKVNSTSVRN